MRCLIITTSLQSSVQSGEDWEERKKKEGWKVESKIQGQLLD